MAGRESDLICQLFDGNNLAEMFLDKIQNLPDLFLIFMCFSGDVLCINIRILVKNEEKVKKLFFDG